MITIIQPGLQIAQARAVMLDLLTSGVPRPDIGILIYPLYDDQHDQRAPAAGQPASEVSDEYAYESIASLDNALTHRLPNGGVLTAVGPLAEALRQAGGATDAEVIQNILGALDVPEAEARGCAQQLDTGGALVAVQTDSQRETIVRGVFAHALNPALNGPPAAQAEPDVDTGLRDTPSATVGALSSNTIPGGWGTAGLDLEGLEVNPDDPKPER